MENRVVISTVGTSLLTNQINRSESKESTWFSQLSGVTNLKLDEIEKNHPEVVKILQELKNRAENKLKESNTQQIRRISAELNGIYGLYEEEIQRGKQDIHYLISTDTYSGKITAEIVENFLKTTGVVNTNIVKPSGLSTANTQKFSEGVDELIDFLSKQKENWQGYKVCFNLVGGFKTLQGYLNTIGMLYADEIIYIFEGKRAELITIPRLPIAVDKTLIKPYTVQLALMDTGALDKSEVEKIPEALIGDVDGKKVLSTWGKLIWDESKKDLLSDELLDFPWLDYQDIFRTDYKKIKDWREKVQLHETLAKVSYLLEESNGDTSPLKKDYNIKYDPYEGTDNIDHFRVTRALRISCKKMDNGKLSLRYYGSHAHVEGKEFKKK
ncbi:CRISPR-associated protein [Hydrocoleum sp. CS-953]|uniref:putative CRISPR-associated protein n=1 Tax=Hydrocoleum sp. CS-953 TaxID=1671698 RepID=UPI000B9C5495|nr:putative CRISPR-associated protein [Hydrocoleum sp. CS-953]OZH51979.1 CRISPR-associated protein [Hydrocoleum sp. CS-953]